ncbi:MAG: OmpH family outer membrane protein [Chitinispirillaceae bacterium]|jgi:outer membrane protein
MRKSSIITAMAVGIAALSASAQLKMGYVNSEIILSKYAGTKEAQDKFNKEQAKWEQEGSQRKNEVTALKDQIDKQSLLLSAERKKELEDSLQQKYIQYQQFLQDKFGQKGEIYTKEEELMKPIIDKINLIIQKIAKDENYDFIFDARASGVVYAMPKYDLTERVLLLLNKEK